MNSLILSIWGKTNRGVSSFHERQLFFHPLLYHLVDVALVAEEIWEHHISESTRRLVGSGLKLSSEESKSWVCFLAGIHDIGKCTPEFQRKDERLARQLTDVGLWMPQGNGEELFHSLTGTVILKRYLEKVQKMVPANATRWATVVGGHHGVFPEDLKRYQEDNYPHVYGGKMWADLRDEVIHEFGNVFPILRVPTAAPTNAVQLAVAGLISVADWLASNQAYFPCNVGLGQRQGSDCVLTYRESASKKAVDAVCASGWRELPLIDASPFSLLFPGKEARPSQVAIERAAQRLDGPALVIVEAPTGEGKTEAALMIADRLNQVGGQRGIYFALPTQATSNQMFGRVCEFLGRRYAGVADLPVMLSHSHAMLSPEMLELLRRGKLLPQLEDTTDGLFAAEWFVKPKRGLLSPFGIGTVDQALMAALITKHVFVRLFGLAGKVVIVDEVHAYDTYMGTLLERLLEWLGALRSSVVLLSATLPKSRKDALLLAWSRGAGMTVSAPEGSGYPRISIVSDMAEAYCETLPVSNRSVRSVKVTWVTEEDVLQSAMERVADGGCGAIVCNTVRVAQDFFENLLTQCESLPEAIRPLPILFHARFAFSERQAIEEQVLRLFGPDSKARPTRAILIATQVIEQSLDLDFDVMFSELAPVDLVLQRAGRLHRHERKRPIRLSDPEIVLIQPPVDPDGLPRFSVANCYVYSEYILFKTWLELRQRESIRSPDDLEELIQGVYDESVGTHDGPAGVLLTATLSAFQREKQDEANEAGNRYVLGPLGDANLSSFTRNPLAEDRPKLPRALQAITRNAEPSVSCILLFRNEVGIFLDREFTAYCDLNRSPTLERTRDLLFRSITLTNKSLISSLFSIDIPSVWRKNTILHQMRPIFLDKNCSGTIGSFAIECGPILGFRILNAERE